jgi:hypothetical protein
MRFYLVYRGPLSASSNKSKAEEVATIRDEFHSQLKFLWQTSNTLYRLRFTAQVPEKEEGEKIGSGVEQSPFYIRKDYSLYATLPGWVDLCAPIPLDGKSYIPLIRSSLDLNCHLDILFLRQEDPGALVLQGGDVDNRIKTLFDALRIPSADEQKKNPPKEDPTYCLLESDTLISGFHVNTGRLLMPDTNKPNEVHLVIEVTVRVLNLGTWNVCLMGD